MLQLFKANIKKILLLIESTLFFPAMNLLSSPPGLKDGLGHLVLLMKERGCLLAFDGLQIFHLFDPSGTGFMSFQEVDFCNSICSKVTKFLLLNFLCCHIGEPDLMVLPG
jgi:hypothetical protein